jgi:hypothetical protein
MMSGSHASVLTSHAPTCRTDSAPRFILHDPRGRQEQPLHQAQLVEQIPGIKLLPIHGRQAMTVRGWLRRCPQCAAGSGGFTHGCHQAQDAHFIIGTDVHALDVNQLKGDGVALVARGQHRQDRHAAGAGVVQFSLDPFGLFGVRRQENHQTAGVLNRFFDGVLPG